jgi:hypothetical protein
LFCRWWNCLSLYIKWKMSWWSRTCDELGIITSRPYITFSSLSLSWCFDAPSIWSNDDWHTSEVVSLNLFLSMLSVFYSLFKSDVNYFSRMHSSCLVWILVKYSMNCWPDLDNLEL